MLNYSILPFLDLSKILFHLIKVFSPSSRVPIDLTITKFLKFSILMCPLRLKPGSKLLVPVGEEEKSQNSKIQWWYTTHIPILKEEHNKAHIDQSNT